MDSEMSHGIARPEECVDPEPFTIFLGVLGFLGSVASIAGYVEFKRDKRHQLEESRFKLLREARDLLMSIEADTIQVQASLQKLEFILIQGTSELHAMPISNLELAFGSCKPIFTYQGFKKYQEILLELNRLVGRNLETTSQLLQKLYNCDVKITEDTYHQLIALQQKLNSVMRERLTYQEGFRVYYELIAFTQGIIGDVRRILSEFLR